MYVESFHNEIKTHYFKRRTNRRLDTLLDTLLVIEKNKYIQHLYKKNVNMPTIYSSLSEDKSHSLGMKIGSDQIICVTESSWKIHSQTLEGILYEVEKVRDHCSIPDHCSVKCSLAPCYDLCVHLYTCSCPHRSSICKHIHKIHIFLKENFKLNILSQDCGDILETRSEVENFRERNVSNEKIQLQSSSQNALTEIGRLSQNSEVIEGLELSDLQQVCKIIRLANDIIEAGVGNSSFTVSLPKFTSYTKISPNSKLQTQKAQLQQTIKDRKKSQLELKFKSPFSVSLSPPICSKDNLTEYLFHIGPYGISRLYLKSLDMNMSKQEAQLCQKADKNFRIGYLYDHIIDAYLHIITSPDSSICAKSTIFNEYITRHKEKISDQSLEFLNNCSLQKIFLPFNLGGNHWALFVFEIFWREKFIQFLVFDSNNKNALKSDLMIEHIQVWMEILNQKFLNYTISCCQPEHAMQHDGSSCGVYVCWFVMKILKNETVSGNFSPSEFRKEIYSTIVADFFPPNMEEEDEDCP